MGGSGAHGAYRTAEGEEFTVSDFVEGENTQFDGFHTSPMNRVLITHALMEAGYGDRVVDLITGLPVSDFFLGNGDVDAEKLAEKTANLKKGVTIISSARLPARIGDVNVGCQAVSAYLDYIVNDDLTLRHAHKGGVAIVDIGGRTTDIAVIFNDQGAPQIDYSKSGTENVGVLDVYGSLKEQIRTKFRLRDNFSLTVLDEAVRTGRIELFGQPQDVADLVRIAMTDIKGKIAREIDRRIGRAANLKAVVFVGGGSALLRDDLVSLFPNATVAEDPEFANARGLLKYQRLNRGGGVA
jgi:plasmid segregation protein ParM